MTDGNTRAWETSEQHTFILVNALIYFGYRALRSREVTVQAPVVPRYLPVQTVVTLRHLLVQISVTETYSLRFFSLPPGMLAFYLNCTIFCSVYRHNHLTTLRNITSQVIFTVRLVFWFAQLCACVQLTRTACFVQGTLMLEGSVVTVLF